MADSPATNNNLLRPLGKSRGQPPPNHYGGFVVIQNYIATTGNELDVSVGDIVKVYEDHGEHMYWALRERDEMMGYLPRNCLAVHECRMRRYFGRRKNHGTYIVIRDYVAKEEDELQLSAGELVTVFVEKRENYHWAGSLRVWKEGFVPLTHVLKHNCLVETIPLRTYHGTFVVTHDRIAAAGGNELQVSVGDRVKVMREDEHWCWVWRMRDGKEGYVPRNYLAEQSVSQLAPGKNIDASSSIDNSEGKKYGTFVVTHDHIAISEDELQVSVGDRVKVLDKYEHWCWVWRLRDGKEGFVIRKHLAEQSMSQLAPGNNIDASSSIDNSEKK